MQGMAPSGGRLLYATPKRMSQEGERLRYRERSRKEDETLSCVRWDMDRDAVKV